MHVNPKKIAEETCVMSQIEHSLNINGKGLNRSSLGHQSLNKNVKRLNRLSLGHQSLNKNVKRLNR